MQDTVRENLLQIQEDIAPYKPNIIAVTKYFDEEAIEAAKVVSAHENQERLRRLKKSKTCRRKLEITQSSILSGIFKLIR